MAIIFFVLSAVMIALAIWMGYLAIEYKKNRFEYKNEAMKYHEGSWKHFWYYNRFKLWWYLSFVFGAMSVGFIVAAVQYL